MTAFQRQVEGPLYMDGGCFDMWHDYMNLATLLRELCSGKDNDHIDIECPKRDTEVPWSSIQTSRQGNSRSPSGTGSASSLSSTSGSGTSSEFCSSSLSSTSGSGTSSKCCRFCKQNGETVMIYRSHSLKTADGKVSCPILRSYACPICGATGDHAHTRRYCPRAQREVPSMQKLPKFW
ncbi:nanos homolog 1-like [Halichoeres trimaculatus]|uniref:nanos homolog 1-like n=1 Tax=Halichoeres trimaculatus TaxID=147232 RepID=UPI003D9EF1BE